MASLFHCFLFLCSIFFMSPSAAKTPFRPKALILPVSKTKCTHQYITRIHQRTPLVPVRLTVDLGGRFMWVNCEKGYVSSSYKPVSCDTGVCSPLHSHGCIIECPSPPKPGCYNNTCGDVLENRVAQTSGPGGMSQDIVSLQSFNGRNPDMTVSVPNFPLVCGSTLMLENLANGVTGMAGLGRSHVAMPAQFSTAFGFQRKFAICLTSSRKSNGAIFFGDGPYSIIAKDLLNYTPLIKNNMSTLGPEDTVLQIASSDYFISVKSIRVGGEDIKANKTLLSINNEGKGGTRISTIKPYTILHTSIFQALVKAFVKAYDIKLIPPVVEPPFGACFPSFSEGSGPEVPLIDLVLEGQGSVYWRIWAANSLVKISSTLTCLGFVDGGADPFTSIVIGGHQIEDNLLQFDLDSSRLGFSSSLFRRNTTCSNFT